MGALATRLRISAALAYINKVASFTFIDMSQRAAPEKELPMLNIFLLNQVTHFLTWNDVDPLQSLPCPSSYRQAVGSLEEVTSENSRISGRVVQLGGCKQETIWEVDIRPEKLPL